MLSLWRGSRARARLQGLFQAKICNWALRHFLSILLAQPTGPIVGATNKPSGSVKLGVGAEIRPVARHGIAQFRRRRYCQGTGRGATCKSYGVSNEKKKRKMSVLLAFCHTFMYCIYPRKNQWTVGELDYSIFIDQDKGEKCFFRTFSRKLYLFSIIDKLSKSGSSPTSRPAAKRYCTAAQYCTVLCYGVTRK